MATRRQIEAAIRTWFKSFGLSAAHELVEAIAVRIIAAILICLTLASCDTRTFVCGLLLFKHQWPKECDKL